ncbi:MAG: DUF1343 domain-containing protein [Bacteroidia bacterium]|nr:DUF1343 domain-containing protein [Bacteroidia bacterium]
MKRTFIFFHCYFTFFFLGGLCIHAQPESKHVLRLAKAGQIIVGAERLGEYLPDIKGKNVAIVANQTSMAGQVHLVDTLFNMGIRIQCVFAPEHGFRGKKGAGERVKDERDPKTGIPVISLYGKHLKPSASDLKNVQAVIFDIQDVGARFYTYISTLHLVMEACASQHIPLIVLDRPNPNGYYVDGPILNRAFRSFVGLDPIPVVHGLTVGEYALMVNGEHWLNTSEHCMLKVVSAEGYDHATLYTLPVPPSPNLPDMAAVYLYPSLCFFEGTSVSVGRGTSRPFRCFGFPGFKGGNFNFVPVSIPGVSENPPYKNQLCSGIDLSGSVSAPDSLPHSLNFHWLYLARSEYPDSTNFFNGFFNKLAGTFSLRRAIENGMSETDLHGLWKNDLEVYKKMRKKYLLYEDFE